MKYKWSLFVLGLVVFGGMLGCGITDTVINNTVGGSKGNTVANLWSDVPAVPGAQKEALDLPIAMQVAIQGMIKASASSSDVKLDQFDWIAYTTTQTPQQVSAFYSTERMTSAGWTGTDQSGCTSGSDTTGTAGFCVFGKGKTGQPQTILFVILAQDDKTKQTQIFYVRLEGIVTATPTRTK